MFVVRCSNYFSLRLYATWSHFHSQGGDQNPLPSAFCKIQCESVKLLPISYVRCSMFELFQFMFICNLESFSFARWRSEPVAVCFLQNPIRIGKIITYIVCSLLDVRIISVYVYMPPRCHFHSQGGDQK